MSFFKPDSELRRRIYVMFAVLESSPKYHRYFLPQKHSFLYVFVIFLLGIRAILRLVTGFVVVKLFIRRKAT